MTSCGEGLLHSWRRFGSYDQGGAVAQVGCELRFWEGRGGAAVEHCEIGAVQALPVRNAARQQLDWFYFDMPTSRKMEAWLTEIPPGCDYDLYLKSASGTNLKDSANPDNLDEHIVSGNLRAGRYYLVVAGINGRSASAQYALRVDC